MSAYSKFYDEVYALFHNDGVSLDSGEEVIRDKWISEKKYSSLISYIFENWSSGNCVTFMTPVSKQLAKENRLRLYKRLWKPVLKLNSKKFWDYSIHNLKIDLPDITWSELSKLDTSKYDPHSSYDQDEKLESSYIGNYYLNALVQYKKGLELMVDVDEVKTVNSEIQNIFDLEKPVIIKKKATDKRKIDEVLFWELIENSRNEAEDKSEFIDTLSLNLSAFKATEIRRFQKFLLTFYNQLNNWDNWALAYIVRRGCGDDAFDYFRLWVISKGKFAFETIKDFNVSDFEKVFDLEDPQLEELIFVAENVYEENTGDIMKEPRVKNQKIKGKPFDEDKVCDEYPKICTLFSFKPVNS